jgi:hypothetical protein
VTQDPRCPNCGALVAEDAEWCGQCYQPLRREEPATATAAAADGSARPSIGLVETPGGGSVEVEDGKASWTCPVCGETNAIEVAVCGVCQTPFTRLFVEPEPPPAIAPDRAAIWSLVFPGLGHWQLRRKADAVARFVLFGWTFGALLILVVSRFGKGSLGGTLPLVALFGGSAFAIYVLSALDAYRIAGGEDPVVSSRVLLWASAALVVLSVLIATITTLPAARR